MCIVALVLVTPYTKPALLQYNKCVLISIEVQSCIDRIQTSLYCNKFCCYVNGTELNIYLAVGVAAFLLPCLGVLAYDTSIYTDDHHRNFLP